MKGRCLEFPINGLLGFSCSQPLFTGRYIFFWQVFPRKKVCGSYREVFSRQCDPHFLYTLKWPSGQEFPPCVYLRFFGGQNNQTRIFVAQGVLDACGGSRGHDRSQSPHTIQYPLLTSHIFLSYKHENSSDRPVVTSVTDHMSRVTRQS